MYKKALVVILLITLLALQGSAGQKAPLGTWSDACPCKIPCPCWRTQRANVPRCLNVQLYAPSVAMEKAKQNVVFVLVGSPTTQYGSPSNFSLYVDKGMPTSTLEFMRGFFADNYGIAPHTEKIVSINASLSRDSESVEIPDLLAYKVSASSQMLDVNVEKYLYPWLTNPRQWVSSSVTYKSNGKTEEYEGTNSLSANFDLNQPEIASLSAKCVR
jgi:hypothetical protein